MNRPDITPLLRNRLRELGVPDEVIEEVFEIADKHAEILRRSTPRPGDSVSPVDGAPPLPGAPTFEGPSLPPLPSSRPHSARDGD